MKPGMGFFVSVDNVEGWVLETNIYTYISWRFCKENMLEEWQAGVKKKSQRSWELVSIFQMTEGR